MNNEIVAIHCLCDDILKAMNHRSDVQQQMSDIDRYGYTWFDLYQYGKSAYLSPTGI
jgi:hypothetical protein